MSDEYKGPWMVCIVMHDRVYGGPEEGGWYYDTYDPFDIAALELMKEHELGIFTYSKSEMQIARDNMWEIVDRINKQERRNPNSVFSIGEYSVEVYEGYPKYIPEERPTYE